MCTARCFIALYLLLHRSTARANPRITKQHRSNLRCSWQYTLHACLWIQFATCNVRMTKSRMWNGVWRKKNSQELVMHRQHLLIRKTYTYFELSNQQNNNGTPSPNQDAYVCLVTSESMTRSIKIRRIIYHWRRKQSHFVNKNLAMQQGRIHNDDSSKHEKQNEEERQQTIRLPLNATIAIHPILLEAGQPLRNPK